MQRGSVKLFNYYLIWCILCTYIFMIKCLLWKYLVLIWFLFISLFVVGRQASSIIFDHRWVNILFLEIWSEMFFGRRKLPHHSLHNRISSQKTRERSFKRCKIATTQRWKIYHNQGLQVCICFILSEFSITKKKEIIKLQVHGNYINYR